MTRKLVTWLGEDELHSRVNEEGKTEPVPGPSFTTWRHDDVFIKFPKDVAVLIDDDPKLSPTLALRQQILRKADGNRFFKVEDLPDEEGPQSKEVKGENPDATVEKTLKQQNRPDDPPPELPEPPLTPEHPVGVPPEGRMVDPLTQKPKARTKEKA